MEFLKDILGFTIGGENINIYNGDVNQDGGIDRRSLKKIRQKNNYE